MNMEPRQEKIDALRKATQIYVWEKAVELGCTRQEMFYALAEVIAYWSHIYTRSNIEENAGSLQGDN